MKKGQIVDVLVPQIMEDMDEVVKLVLRERVQQHVAERVVDALVQWIESGEKHRDEEDAKIENENDLENFVPWVQERIIERTIDVMIPQAMKEMITDLMNRLQFTDDAELSMGVNADEPEEVIVTAARETLDVLEKIHAPEDGESVESETAGTVFCEKTCGPTSTQW